MPGATFLEGDKVKLRTVEEEDLDFLGVYNHPEIWQNVLSDRTPQNIEDRREFFEEVICSEQSIDLLICHEEEKVGLVSLIEKGKAERLAKLGLWLHPEHHGNGFGTEACELMVQHGFDQLNFHKIFYRAHGDNEASQRLAEKIGFTEEGKLADHTFTQGDYKDIIYYRMLEGDWENE